VIANYGQRGAEQLGEVAATFSNKPHVYGLTIADGKQAQLCVSALSGHFYYDRLSVSGNTNGNNRLGRAFGVHAPSAKNF